MDPRHSTLDPQHVTLDPRHLDQKSALGNEYNRKLPREGSVGKLVNTATYDCCEPSYLASVSTRHSAKLGNYKMPVKLRET